jgi:hypothetical protein
MKLLLIREQNVKCSNLICWNDETAVIFRRLYSNIRLHLLLCIQGVDFLAGNLTQVTDKVVSLLYLSANLSSALPSFG